MASNRKPVASKALKEKKLIGEEVATKKGKNAKKVAPVIEVDCRKERRFSERRLSRTEVLTARDAAKASLMSQRKLAVLPRQLGEEDDDDVSSQCKESQMQFETSKEEYKKATVPKNSRRVSRVDSKANNRVIEAVKGAAKTKDGDKLAEEKDASTDNAEIENELPKRTVKKGAVQKISEANTKRNRNKTETVKQADNAEDCSEMEVKLENPKRAGKKAAVKKMSLIDSINKTGAKEAYYKEGNAQIGDFEKENNKPKRVYKKRETRKTFNPPTDQKEDVANETLVLTCRTRAESRKNEELLKKLGRKEAAINFG